MWCQRICLSVRPSIANFDPNYLETGRTEWSEIFLRHVWQNETFWQEIITLTRPIRRGV